MIKGSDSIPAVRPFERGVLIVFEGIDGAGKSTQVKRLVANLRELGFAVRVDREPTDGPHGRRLRASATEGRLSPTEELELFIADRREHVTDFIMPGLEAGDVVILDRYYFSNAAYQGSRGLDWAEILRLNEEFAPPPDLLLWLDLDPELSGGRIHRRGNEANEFERLESLLRCREIFSRIRHPSMRQINAGLAVDVVSQAILTEVRVVLGQRIEARTDLSSDQRRELLRHHFGS
jgi:dTMP kinase